MDDLAFDTILGDNGQSDATAGRRVAVHSHSDTHFYKSKSSAHDKPREALLDALLLAHSLLVLLINQTVNPRRTGTTDRNWLSNFHTTERDRVY